MTVKQFIQGLVGQKANCNHFPEKYSLCQNFLGQTKAFRTTKNSKNKLNI